MQVYVPHPFPYAAAGGFAGGLQHWGPARVCFAMTSSEIGSDIAVEPFEGNVIATGLATKEGFRSPYPFRFYHVQPPKAPLPPEINSKGARAVRYATCLIQLREAGNRSAAIALDVLVKECQPIVRPKKTQENVKGLVTPVELDWGSRWRLDDAGRYALELLLWIWRMRHTPIICRFMGGWAASLPEFNDETKSEWWELGHSILDDVYRSIEKCPELRALVSKPRKLKAGPSHRDPIIRAIRRRFYSFAPP
jgi:hypothetical protein